MSKHLKQLILKYNVKSLLKYVNEVLGIKMQSCDELMKKANCIASIEAERSGKVITIYFAYKKAFLARNANMFYMEEPFSTQDLQDLACEMTNMIAGQAKVLMQEGQGNTFAIGTPKIQEFISGTSLLYKTVRLDDDEVMIII